MLLAGLISASCLKQHRGVDDDAAARRVDHRIAIDDAAAIVSRQDDEPTLYDDGERLDTPLPAWRQVTRSRQLLLKPRRQVAYRGA